MKTYIKPIVKVIEMEEELLNSNSVGTVSGIDGVSVSTEEYSGGAADSRRGGSLWDEE